MHAPKGLEPASVPQDEWKSPAPWRFRGLRDALLSLLFMSGTPISSLTVCRVVQGYPTATATEQRAWQNNLVMQVLHSRPNRSDVSGVSEILHQGGATREEVSRFLEESDLAEARKERYERVAPTVTRQR